jgi:hypothetical protein
VTVQTKSEPPYRTCRECEQQHFEPQKRDGHRFEQAARSVELRQFVAKTLIKTGITVPPAPFRNLCRSQQWRLPVASNVLMSGPLLMKLAAGLGKT